MTTADLPPVTDESAAVQAGQRQQPGSALTLYAINDELLQLLAVREEMAEAAENTDAADAAIAEYMEALPAKVDAVAHVLRMLDDQERFAAEEIARLAQRRRRIASAHERLKQYCCAVLETQPQPKRGSRKLEGHNATLSLRVNGGLQSLDVYDAALVPDELCTARVEMPWLEWLEIRPEGMTADRVPNGELVRAALDAQCWLCSGKDQECSECGGTGKSSVPGARLQERGHHLRVS